jgi:hypothetical protein
MNYASIDTATYHDVNRFYEKVEYEPSSKGRNTKPTDIYFTEWAFI